MGISGRQKPRNCRDGHGVGYRAIFCGILILLCTQGDALADSFPPLGQRFYELGSERSDSVQPARIRAERIDKRGDASGVLRDPIMPDTTRDANDQGTIGLSQATKIGKHRYKEAKFSFAKLEVEGRYSKPRVQFDQKRLQVGKAEEPPRLDFLERLEETAQRSRLLLRDHPTP